MRFEVLYRPAHSLALAHLSPGERVRAEAGAMVGMTPNIEVSTEGPVAQGGVLRGLRRAVLGGESFFTNTYAAVGAAGHVALAPSLCGDMVVHDLIAGEDLLIQGSSWVAAPDSVELDTKFQGFRGLFSGESLFCVAAGGHGPVLLNAFGGIEALDLAGETIVDTGHLVAFTAGIEYRVSKAAAGLVASWLSAEGLVLRLAGRGRLYVQSRNPGEYGRSVGRLLPAREG
jgi:uncharacterized protein (TIGR00266 family)